MQHSVKFKPTVSRISRIGVIMSLLLAVGCGAAATPVVVEREVVKEVERVVVATSTPTPTQVSAEVRREVDKLVVMQMTLGNEQWNPKWDTTNNDLWWRPLHARLISATHDLKLDPENSIVSYWELTDGGLGWEFTIRDGVKFHNGEELNVDDAIFSQRMNVSEEAASVSKVRWARAMEQHATKTGPNSFKILFKEPAPAYLVNGMAEIEPNSSGVVFSKDYYESVGEDGFQANPSPGTAGPFNMVGYTAKVEVLYERFDDYYLKHLRPYPFKQLSIKLIPELSTRVAALAAGEADIITADLNVLDQITSAGGRIVMSPEGNYIWILAHACHNPTDKNGNPIMCYDKRVREALDYAIDKKEIQEMYGADTFKIAGMPTAAPSSLGYETDLDPYPFDPDKARRLLAEAGYPNGDGFNGGRTFNIWTFSGGSVPMLPELSTLVCDHWQTVLNIDCEVRVGEEVSVKGRFYDGLIDGEYLVRPNDFLFDGASRIRGGFAVPDAYASYLGDIEGPRVRKLISTFGTQEERHLAYYEALSILRDAHYDFSPGYVDTPYGVSGRIKSWTPRPLQSAASALWTIEFKE